MPGTHAPPAERLARRLVRRPNGCLEWTGRQQPTGYGSIGVNGKIVGTHRLAWELANGPIPEGKHILHSCDNPPCCEVAHLRLGTQADNNADMAAKGRNHNQQKTQCPRGHEYNETNTYVNNGSRFCRACVVTRRQGLKAITSLTCDQGRVTLCER